MRLVRLQACQFYVASFWLLPVSFDVFMSAATLNPSQMTPVLKHISNASGAEVVLKSNCFEIHGLETEVRSAVTLILELEIVKVSFLCTSQKCFFTPADWNNLQSACSRSTTKSASKLSSRTSIANSSAERKMARLTRL